MFSFLVMQFKAWVSKIADDYTTVLKERLDEALIKNVLLETQLTKVVEGDVEDFQPIQVIYTTLKRARYNLPSEWIDLLNVRTVRSPRTRQGKRIDSEVEWETIVDAICALPCVDAFEREALDVVVRFHKFSYRLWLSRTANPREFTIRFI